jgi:hypothetical protein
LGSTQISNYQSQNIIKEERKEEEDEDLIYAINRRKATLENVVNEDQRFIIEELFDLKAQDYVS